MIEGFKLPEVTFKTRVRDDSIDGPNPFRWEDKTTADYFAGKRVVLFSLPGAFTPTCSTYQLPGFESNANKIKELGIDEIYCFLTEHIGQVAIEFDLLSILFNRFGIACLIILFGIIEITSGTGPQAVKVIKPATGRIKFVLISQVPLSN